MFAEEFQGAGPKQNSSLLEWGVRGPGAEVISTKSAGNAEDGRVRERGMSGDSVGGCVGRHPQSGWEGKRGNSVGRRWCKCGH